MYISNDILVACLVEELLPFISREYRRLSLKRGEDYVDILEQDVHDLVETDLYFQEALLSCQYLDEVYNQKDLIWIIRKLKSRGARYLTVTKPSLY